MERAKIIAEIGWNHLGDMYLASQMIKAAAFAGADYAKFQTWSEERLKPGPWDNDGRRELYKKAELSEQDHIYLAEQCSLCGIKFLTSCFCESDLGFIRTLTNEVKIPSTECSNIKLVTKAVDLFDTVYLSTGASVHSDFSRWFRNPKIVMLHCVSCYPCTADRINLPRLAYLASVHDRVGYSGHYPGILDAIAAVSMGACIVEKHFTIDQGLPGRDNKFSILPDALYEMRESCNAIAQMKEDRGIDFQECEKEMREIYSGRWNGNNSSNPMP